MWYRKETFANTQKPSEHLRKSHLVSRSAIRVCSNEFTATVPQPERNLAHDTVPNAASMASAAESCMSGRT